MAVRASSAITATDRVDKAVESASIPLIVGCTVQIHSNNNNNKRKKCDPPTYPSTSSWPFTSILTVFVKYSLRVIRAEHEHACTTFLWLVFGRCSCKSGKNIFFFCLLVTAEHTRQSSCLDCATKMNQRPTEGTSGPFVVLVKQKRCDWKIGEIDWK